MENTTQTTSTPVAPVSKQKAWIVIGFLVLAVAFWLWSVAFLESRTMDKKAVNAPSKPVQTIPATPASDEQIADDLNAAAQSNIEIELNNIDNEFN